MSDIPTTEPTEITAGDYVQWKKEGSACVDPNGDSCLASDSWALTYALVNSAGQITITADASGDDYLVTLSAATTAAYTAGTYHWQAYVTLSDERYTVDAGTITIKPNFAAQTSGYDNRGHVKTVLDALEATLAGRASKDQMNTVIAGERIDKMTPAMLLRWRSLYMAEYEMERRAERIANGLGHDGNIYVRFTDA